MRLAAATLTLLLASLGLALPAGAAEIVTLCHENADVRPWRMQDGSGLNYDLLKMVEKRLGIGFHIVALPWKRCLAQLKANEVQGAFAASFRPDRLEMGVYPGDGRTPDASKRLHIDRYVLLRQRGKPVTWDGKRIRGLDGAVGAQLGYSITEQLRAMEVQIDEGSQSALELAQKLAAARVGAAALLEGEASVVLATHPELASALEILPLPLVEKPYYLFFSHAFMRARPELATAIWKAIEEARNSAEYKKREKRALDDATLAAPQKKLQRPE